jgi:hypothetical protein
MFHSKVGQDDESNVSTNSVLGLSNSRNTIDKYVNVDGFCGCLVSAGSAFHMNFDAHACYAARFSFLEIPRDHSGVVLARPVLVKEKMGNWDMVKQLGRKTRCGDLVIWVYL